jgi:hypothetical protein
MLCKPWIFVYHQTLEKKRQYYKTFQRYNLDLGMSSTRQGDRRKRETSF